MPKAAQKSKRVPLELKTDTACAERGAIEPLFSLFVFLVSLREEIRARKDTDERAKHLRAAYNAALVDAIAAEDDSDDWSELEVMHAAQREAMHRATRYGTWRTAMGEEVTIERLERALALCARLVVMDGPKAAPFFERIERELAAMRQTQDTVSRAKRLLENLRSPMQCKLLDAAET